MEGTPRAQPRSNPFSRLGLALEAAEQGRGVLDLLYDRSGCATPAKTKFDSSVPAVVNSTSPICMARS